MESSEIELYSDLVKIGLPILGTLIGGVVGALSTWHLAKLNHDRVFEKEKFQQRISIILKVSDDVAEFEHLAGRYASALSNEIRGAPNVLNLEDCKSALSDNHIHIRKARVNLKLLGLKKAEKSLEEYIELTRDVYSQGMHFDSTRISDITNQIVRGPIKFYEALGEEMASNN